MSQQLDRHKPLWEMWMVEGLEHGHWALVSKVHHCMVDGVSGTDLLTVVLDAEPRARVPAARRVARRARARQRAARRATRSSISWPAHTSSCARRGPRRVRRGRCCGQLGELGRGLRAWAGVVRPTPVSSLNGPIGPHRRWDWARTTLADVKTVRSALGGTVNDVVLTVLTRGFRDLLLARDEDVERARGPHARAGIGAHAG